MENKFYIKEINFYNPNNTSLNIANAHGGFLSGAEASIRCNQKANISIILERESDKRCMTIYLDGNDAFILNTKLKVGCVVILELNKTQWKDFNNKVCDSFVSSSIGRFSSGIDHTNFFVERY